MSNALLWAVQLLQLWMEGKEEIEMADIRQAIQTLTAAQRDRTEAPEFGEAGPPRPGSAEYVDMMETLETEAAAWPEGQRHHHCDCEDCHEHNY